MIETILLALLLVLALLSDIKTYKIKNTIILPSVLAGIITNLCINGINNLYTVFIGILIPIICLIPLYLLKMLGAGDIKLFSAIGAIMGYRFVLSSMIFSFLAGGIIALFIMLIRKNFKKRFTYLFQYLKYCFVTFSIQPYIEPHIDISNTHSRFPFAIAVVCGTIIALL